MKLKRVDDLCIDEILSKNTCNKINSIVLFYAMLSDMCVFDKSVDYVKFDMYNFLDILDDDEISELKKEILNRKIKEMEVL